MNNLAVIGYPLSHSFSPGYFENKFVALGLSQYHYSAIEIENISGIQEVILQNQLMGFNVTIPHKKSIFPYLDELDKIALEIGSVNCVKVFWDGNNSFKTKGYNTDWIGFSHLLDQLKTSPKKALVLGTGGAAAAVHYALRKRLIPYIEVSREAKEESISYSSISASMLKEVDVVINTTPLGMYPNTDEKPPIPYSLLLPKHGLIDLIYNPAVTSFLTEGQKIGCQTVNGMEMLQIQAEASWEIWMSPHK